MNVLVLANYFDRDGGTSKLLSEARHLAGRGVRLVVVVPCNPFAKADVRARLRALGVAFHFAPTHFRTLYPFLPLSLWMLKRLARRERIDVIHAHHGRALVLGAILGRLLRLPLVYTIHGTSRRELPQLLRGLWFGRVSRVLAVSEESAAHFLARVDFPLQRLAIVRNAVDLSHFREAPAGGEEQRLVYISRLDRDKRRAVEAVLEAVALLSPSRPRLVLRIVGDGRERRRVARAAEALNSRLGREAVTLSGWAADPAGHYAGAGAVLGVGRCVIEAAAMGRPALVVGSERIGGWLAPGNFRSRQRANFSGRDSPVAVTGEEVAAELSRYPGIAAAAAAAAALVRRDHDAVIICREIAGIYEQAVALHPAGGGAPGNRPTRTAAACRPSPR